MKMVSTKTKTILSYLGRGILIGGITYHAFQAFEQFLFPRSGMYQLALHLVTRHPEAIKYLGEPIIDEYIDLNLSRNKQSNNSCYFSVPLKGSNAAGTMRYLLNITDTESREYYISEIDLFINNEEKTKISILNKSTPINIQ